MSTETPHTLPVANKATGAKSNKAKIQVIARAASVLRTLENEADGLSLGAIAQRLKLPRSTIQRIVGALEAENLLIAASPTGRVKLGPALLRLSASVQNPVSAIAKPYMVDMARDLGEAVELAVMGRDQGILIDQATNSHQQPTSTIAEKFPLHCSAAGKAMLALLSDDEIERKIGRNYTPCTPHSRTTFNALLPDLQEARNTGVAYDMEEHTLGIRSIAVGFRDALGNRLALSVSLPNERFEELSSQAEQKLLEVRDLLLAHLISN